MKYLNNFIKFIKQEFTDLVKKNVYDSIIVGDKFGEICVFEPHQIKSINNDGSWNIDDNNINS
jgi:predicted transport protein